MMLWGNIANPDFRGGGGEGRWDDGGEGGGPGIDKNLKTFTFVDFKIPTCRKQTRKVQISGFVFADTKSSSKTYIC